MNSNVTAAIKLGSELGVDVRAWGGDMVLVAGVSPMSAHRALTGGIQWAARGR
ncbi:DUF7460 domain-containing protein [Mycolicibacterium houstonense]|uniref:DUF7460 domain-containing protein n=1 Tax=Mycolicibacterium houstonense TaxID=146021 RepID=UPI000A828346|nr:hypothetical protein [Mycolicibacterium houstonense]